MRHIALASVLITLTIAIASGADSKTPPAKRPSPVQVQFTDGSTLKLTLRDDAVEIGTPYGRLRVPTSEIRRIEFATRIDEDVLRSIEIWIADLGSPQFTVRETASTELRKIGEPAYHALVKAAKATDPEVRKRIDELIEQICENTPAERLDFRPFDVVYTPHSKIAGRIDGASLRANTTQFGPVGLKLTDLRTVRMPNAESDSEVQSAIADPGSLSNFHGQVGKIVAIRLTGSIQGTTWGTDQYTLDSALATAAVHAGIAKPGQTVVVRVKIVAPPPAFQGSTRHGVTSSAYGPFPGAFEFVRKSAED